MTRNPTFSFPGCFLRNISKVSSNFPEKGMWCAQRKGSEKQGISLSRWTKTNPLGKGDSDTRDTEIQCDVEYIPPNNFCIQLTAGNSSLTLKATKSVGKWTSYCSDLLNCSYLSSSLLQHTLLRFFSVVKNQTTQLQNSLQGKQCSFKETRFCKLMQQFSQTTHRLLPCPRYLSSVTL